MRVYRQGEVKLQKIIRKQLDYIECDSCHQAIPMAYNYNTTDYFVVNTHHHRWGNDSCESYEEFDICPNCINNFVAEYLLGAVPTMTIEVVSKCGGGYEWKDEEYHIDLNDNDACNI